MTAPRSVYPRLLCTWRWSHSRRRRWRRCSWLVPTRPWQIVMATRRSTWLPSRMEEGWFSFYCGTERWALCWSTPTQQVRCRSYCSSEDPIRTLHNPGFDLDPKTVCFHGYQVCVRSIWQFWPISCLLSGSFWTLGPTWRLRSAAVDGPRSTWPPRPTTCRWPAACCWRCRPVSKRVGFSLFPVKSDGMWCFFFFSFPSSGKCPGGLLHLQRLHPPPHCCREGLCQANSSPDGCRYEMWWKSLINESYENIMMLNNKCRENQFFQGLVMKCSLTQNSCGF